MDKTEEKQRSRRQHWSAKVSVCSFLGFSVYAVIFVCVLRVSDAESDMPGDDTPLLTSYGRGPLDSAAVDEPVEQKRDTGRSVGLDQSTEVAGRTTERLPDQRHIDNKDSAEEVNPRPKSIHRIRSGAQYKNINISRSLFDLNILKKAINEATSHDEILQIVLKYGLCKASVDISQHSGHSTPSEHRDNNIPVTRTVPHRRRHRRSSNTAPCAHSSRSSKDAGIADLLANATCSRKEVEVAGEFRLTEKRNQQLRVCGPIVTPRDPNDDAASKVAAQRQWSKSAMDHGICEPMEMIIDLIPQKTINDDRLTLASVKRCRVLYNGRDSNNVTCVPVKKKKKIIWLRDVDQKSPNITRYILTDHVECSTKTKSKPVQKRKETKKTKDPKYRCSLTKTETRKCNKGSKNKNSCCPWPFKRAKDNRCICIARQEGSPGYLVYKMYRNVQRGAWKLEHRHAQCVKLGKCSAPYCDGNKRYSKKEGRCVDRQTTTTSINEQRTHRTATSDPAET